MNYLCVHLARRAVSVGAVTYQIIKIASNINDLRIWRSCALLRALARKIRHRISEIASEINDLCFLQ